MAHESRMSEDVRDCIQDCMDCQRICLETANHCLTTGGNHAGAAHGRPLGVAELRSLLQTRNTWSGARF